MIKKAIEHLKQQCTSKLSGNSLVLQGTNVKEPVDLLTDAGLLIPCITPFGLVSAPFMAHAKVIYDRHKEELFKLKEIHIHGHSLGGGLVPMVAMLLIWDDYPGDIHISGKGSVKTISKKVAKTLSLYIKSVKWEVRYRDPVPMLGWWSEPIHNTPRTGDKKKWFLDYDVKEHMMYW